MREDYFISYLNKLWFNSFLCSLSALSENFTVDPDYPEFDYDQITAHRRLVQDLLDPEYYENTVHPSINFKEAVRVNLSMSLYQILQVDERSQSLTVNVWMVQDW